MNKNSENQKNIEMRLKRLHHIEKTFQKIRKLIIKENNLDSLISHYCSLLVETGSYASSWIILLDDNKTPTASAQSGIKKEFSILLNNFKQNRFNACSEAALKQPGVVLIDNPTEACRECVLFGKQPGHKAFTIRIEHNNQIFGLLSVEVPIDIALTEDEVKLFAEQAVNLGLALHALEMEKEREEHQRFLNIMSDTAMYFLKVSNTRDLYKCIAKDLLKLTGGNAYIVVASIDDKKKEFTVQAISGWGNIIQKASHLFGENPIGVSTTPYKEIVDPLRSGKLNLFDGDLYTMLRGTKSKQICTAISLLAKIGNIYNIGLTKDNKLFGNITILRKKGYEAPPNKQIVEAFVNQAAIALQKHHTENELLKSEKRFRFLAENSLDCIWMMNLDLEFTYTSPSVKLLLDYTPEELIGTKLSSYFTSEEFSKFSACILDFFERDRSNPLTPVQTVMIKKGGEEVDVEITYKPIFGTNNEILGLQGTTRNVANRVKTEKELQNIEKLKSVGILAGGIAHDFNNILTGVYGNISLAMNKLQKDLPEYMYLEEANNSMNRAILLTKQLLTFAKGGEPIKESVLISSLIKDVVRFDLSGSNILPIFRQDNNLWATDADKGQIQQVFSNLTVNARHAMPEGGHIFVSLANKTITHHTVLAEGNYIKITFKDEGTGIESENLDRIFEPYFSTKASGSGLGLSTVYSVITKHDGFVEVVSEKNKGTNFTIFLPASDKMEAREPEQGTTASKGIRKEKHRILVMDDEQVICELLTEMLEMLGYDSDFAYEGNETIKKYQKSLQVNNPYDLVIMDLTIPGGKGGLETVKEILEINPNAKVIVSSGYGHGKIMSNYKEYGFIDIAPKPYTMDKLEEILHRVL